MKKKKLIDLKIGEKFKIEYSMYSPIYTVRKKQGEKTYADSSVTALSLVTIGEVYVFTEENAEKIIARSKVGNYDYNVIVRYTEGKNKPFAVEREYREVKNFKDVIENFSGLPSAFKCFESVSGKKFNPAFKAMFYKDFCLAKLNET